MSFSVADSEFVSACRLQMVDNMQKGLAPEAGIDKEKLKRALEIIRQERSIGAAGGGKKTKKESGPVIEIDLEAFMKGGKL